MMLFVKERGSNPLNEERQILDGMKLILENGWIIETNEIKMFFSMIGLQIKARELVAQTSFQEFIYALCILFDLVVEDI